MNESKTHLEHKQLPTHSSFEAMTPLKRLKWFYEREKVQSKLFIGMVLIPTFVWFFTFMVYPIFLTFKDSFTNANLAYDDEQFTGLENYRRLWEDPIFHIALKNTLFAVLYTVPATLVLSLAAALLLNSFGKRIREAFTLIYFLPVVTSMVAISLVWSWLYNPSYGLFNYLLSAVGLPAQGFINSPTQALPSVSAIQIWKDVGFYSVIFLAAIRTIPRDYYEAAELDGANRFQIIYNITIPLLKPTIVFVSIVATINSFKMFDAVRVLTDGGPGNSTMVLVLYIIRMGITNSDIGYAAAIAVVMFVLVLIVTLLQWLFTRADKSATG